jgi:hypothetical protein
LQAIEKAIGRKAISVTPCWWASLMKMPLIANNTAAAITSKAPRAGFKGAAGRLVTAGLADSRDTQIPGG